MNMPGRAALSSEVSGASEYAPRGVCVVSVSRTRPTPGTSAVWPPGAILTVGRNTRPIREVSDDVTPGKPIPACLRTRLCAPSQPTTYLVRSW